MDFHANLAPTWERYAGFTNVELAVPVTEKPVFELASLTNQFSEAGHIGFLIQNVYPN